MCEDACVRMSLCANVYGMQCVCEQTADHACLPAFMSPMYRTTTHGMLLCMTIHGPLNICSTQQWTSDVCSHLPEGDIAALESVGLAVVGVTGFEKTFVTEIIPLGSVGEYLASDYIVWGSLRLTPHQCKCTYIPAIVVGCGEEVLDTPVLLSFPEPLEALGALLPTTYRTWKVCEWKLNSKKRLLQIMEVQLHKQCPVCVNTLISYCYSTGAIHGKGQCLSAIESQGHVPVNICFAHTDVCKLLVRPPNGKEPKCI